jgi:hypothetical protein
MPRHTCRNALASAAQAAPMIGAKCAAAESIKEKHQWMPAK